MNVNLKAKPFYLNESQISWVNTTLEKMTLEEKIGQLFFMMTATTDEAFIDMLTVKYHAGGIMGRPMALKDACDFAAKAQSKAKIPLLISANLEAGGDGLIVEGTNVGPNLEIAATGESSYAGKQGLICAKEAMAAGANLAFAPVIDIEKNFRNPIMNTRTYGNDAEFVRDCGIAYLKAVQKEGMAASIKHFPGDGVDERDQHLVTTINSLSCEEWDESYGKVYEGCIEADAMTVMVGHIMQPAYTRHFNPNIKDEDILPASLSKELMGDLLRGKLGFNGLIMTDASTMAGMCIPMPRKKAVPAAIAAGADMFTFCRNIEEDYNYMLQGYKDGVITEDRLNEAVTRILATKAALNLHSSSLIPDYETARTVVGCAEFKKIAKECADKAVTLVKNKENILPVTPDKYKRVLLYPVVPDGDGFFNMHENDVIELNKKALEKEGFEVDIFEPDPGMEGEAKPFSYIESNYDLLIYVANLSTRSNQTVVRIDWAMPMGANCPNYINSVPTIFISYANPYHLLDAPRIKTYINAYVAKPETVEQVIDKLVGRSKFTGICQYDAFCGQWDTRL